MVILGIETTCDETAAAVVRRPTTAAGEFCPMWCSHRSANMPNTAAWCRKSPPAPMSRRSIASSPRRWPRRRYVSALDGIAAAAGPGLIGGVIVGLTTAKAIALTHGKPLIAVNHLEAHALTARLTDATPFPYCLFLASGGHTPDPRRTRRRRLRAARRHGRRRHRRGVRQDRETPGPRLSGRAAGGEGSGARRCHPLRAAAADERASRRRFLASRA